VHRIDRWAVAAIQNAISQGFWRNPHANSTPTLRTVSHDFYNISDHARVGQKWNSFTTAVGGVVTVRSIKTAVHFAKLEFSADEQHAVCGATVEVKERRDDRLAF
jgi:hypothetical protein